MAACAFVLPVSVAIAHTANKHKVTETVLGRVLTSNSKLIEYTGTITDKANGNGAVISQSTPTKTPGRFNEKMVAFFPKGSITLRGFEIVTSNPDGSTSFTGTIKAVSGTGAFKGVAGTLKLPGKSTAADPTAATFKVSGSLSY